jgi:hypothetical protein
MPSSNLPDPEKIPDMRLDEPTDKPSPVHEKIDVASSYQPKEVPIKQSPAEPAPTPPGPREWLEGDDVLAPWEPMFLYPGVIKQIKIDDAHGDQALISFDDGGEGWVYLYSLCPLELKIGQKVQVRHPHGNRYSPAEVIEVDGEDVQIRHDGGDSDWTTIVCIRVPCTENGPGAATTKFAPWQGPPMGAGAVGGSGIPSWVWTVGIIILMMVLRFGCRAMNH